MTGKQIISKIRRLHRDGKPLNITAVKRRSPELMEAVYAIKPYFGWKGALEKAGLSYDDIEVELLDFCICGICSKEYAMLPAHLIRTHRGEFPGAELMCKVLRARMRTSRKKPVIPHWEPLWSHEYGLDRLWAIYRQGYPVNPEFIGSSEDYLYMKLSKSMGGWDRVDGTGYLGISVSTRSRLTQILP